MPAVPALGTLYPASQLTSTFSFQSRNHARYKVIVVGCCCRRRRSWSGNSGVTGDTHVSTRLELPKTPGCEVTPLFSYDAVLELLPSDCEVGNQGRIHRYVLYIILGYRLCLGHHRRARGDFLV